MALDYRTMASTAPRRGPGTTLGGFAFWLGALVVAALVLTGLGFWGPSLPSRQWIE